MNAIWHEVSQIVRNFPHENCQQRHTWDTLILFSSIISILIEVVSSIDPTTFKGKVYKAATEDKRNSPD